MPKRKPAVFLAFMGTALLLSAVPSAVLAKSFEGRKLYTTYCLVCHGEDGRGKGPLAAKLKKAPASLVDSARMEKYTDQDLFRVIESGKAHDKIMEGMPQWGSVLPGPSVQAVVAYLRFMHRSKHPLIADPEAGRAVYANYCASCHGVDGKGNGVMTKILPIKPADHTNPEKMDTLSNDQILKIVRDGDPHSYMPGWKSVLTEAEIRAVVSYLRLLSN